jgi:hypothetical protein
MDVKAFNHHIIYAVTLSRQTLNVVAKCFKLNTKCVPFDSRDNKHLTYSH